MYAVGGPYDNRAPLLFDPIVEPGRPRWYRYFSFLGRWVVDGCNPRFRGQPIVGEGRDLLVDISQRFAFAERKVNELPDLVEWDEVADAVEAIRWDAARHAASLSVSEDAWTDVRHARPGSPQAALRHRLEIERADELAILRGYQRTADRLMNRAADAAAAATVASELGYSLEAAVPSAAADAAQARLEVVIQRLDALTAAWRALDASTDLAAEALRADEHARAEEARLRARRLTEQLDRATGADGGGGDGGGADGTPGSV